MTATMTFFHAMVALAVDTFQASDTASRRFALLFCVQTVLSSIPSLSIFADRGPGQHHAARTYNTSDEATKATLASTAVCISHLLSPSSITHPSPTTASSHRTSAYVRAPLWSMQQ